MKNYFRKSLYLAAVLVGLSQTIIAAAQISDKPNIILVMSDDMGWGLAGKGPELINDIKDPGGRFDVSAQHPKLVQGFKKHFESWWEAVKPEMVNDLEQIKTGDILTFGQKNSKQSKSK